MTVFEGVLMFAAITVGMWVPVLGVRWIVRRS